MGISSGRGVRSGWLRSVADDSCLTGFIARARKIHASPTFFVLTPIFPRYPIMPDFPTCATRFEAISKELAESHTVAANHHKVLQERFLIAFGPAAPTQPRGRPKKEEEGKGRDDSLYRLNVARNGYRAALQISSSFFLVFAMSFAKSNSTKAAVDLLEKVATKRHFSLDNDTMTCFTTWAKEREYDSDEAFVKFYDGLQRIGLSTASA